jgi:hypothetical protein
MEVVMKSIWTGEPNEKQKEQRDFVLRHVLYQNRPCLLADYAQGHSGAAMRNKSEDVKELILEGIQAVVALTTPASGAQQTSIWQRSGSYSGVPACISRKDSSPKRHGLSTQAAVYPPAVPASIPSSESAVS